MKTYKGVEIALWLGEGTYIKRNDGMYHRNWKRLLFALRDPRTTWITEQEVETSQEADDPAISSAIANAFKVGLFGNPQE